MPSCGVVARVVAGVFAAILAMYIGPDVSNRSILLQIHSLRRLDVESTFISYLFFTPLYIGLIKHILFAIS